MFSLQRERTQPLFKLVNSERTNEVSQERGHSNRQINEELNSEQDVSLSGEKLTNLHAKLHQEADKIRKWTNQTEFDIKQKDMKLQESTKTIENLRKSVLDLQLDNESLSMNLQEEIGNREETLQSISSVKVMCEVLKDHLSKTQNKLADCETEKTEIRYMEKEHQQQFESLCKKFKDVESEAGKELERLTELLNNKTKECELLQEEVKQRNIASKTQLNEMLEKLDEKDIENRDIRKEVQKYEDKVHTLQKTIDLLKDDLAGSKDRLRDSNTKHDQLFSELQDLQKAQESLQLELKAGEEKVDALQQEKVGLQSEVELWKEKHAQDVLALQTDLDNCKEQIDKKDKRLRFLETDLERATTEIQEVKCSKDIVIMAKAELEGKVNQLENQRTELLSQIEQNKLTFDQMTMNISDLQLQLDRKQENGSTLIMQISELQLQLDTLQTEKFQLNERVRLLEQESFMKQETINDLQNQMQEKINEIGCFMQKQSEFEQIIESQRKQTDHLQKQLDEASSALSESTANIGAQNKTITKLQKDKEALEKKNNILEKDVEAKCSLHEELREKINEIQLELDLERENNKSIESEKQAHEKAVEGKLQSKEKAASDLEVKNKNLKADVTSKNKQIKDLEKELKGMKSKVTSFMKELTQKSEELLSKGTEVERLQGVLEKMTEEFTNANERMEQMKQVTESCTKEKEEMFKKCESQRSEMSTIMQNYKTDNDKLVNKKEREIESLKNEMKSKVSALQSEIERLRNSVSESGNQMENLQKVYGEKETLLSKLEQENLKKNEELKELQKQLENMYIKTTTNTDVQTSPYPTIKRQSSTPKCPRTPQITTSMDSRGCKTPMMQRTPVILNTPNSKTPQRSILKSLSSATNKKRKVVFASKQEEEEEGSLSEGSDTFEVMETGDKVSHSTPLLLKSPRTRVLNIEPEAKPTDVKHLSSVPLNRTPRGPPVDINNVKKKAGKRNKENLWTNNQEDWNHTSTEIVSKSKEKSSVRTAPQKSGGKFFKSSPKNRKTSIHDRETTWFENDDVFGFAMED